MSNVKLHLSGDRLRREIRLRNLEGAGDCLAETGIGDVPTILYQADENGSHGNFLSASYRRIAADPKWSKRLQKTYTSSARMPFAWERHRAELDCVSSSDALLMNIFCYPGLLCRPQICALLSVRGGLRPEFGWRAGLAMKRAEVDRTEIDMRMGDLLCEAKLTEGGFGTASRERLMRYLQMEEVFSVEDLPWHSRGVVGYQLVRGVLAAQAVNARFAMIYDGRRGDLLETWFQVLRAVRCCELRSRMLLLTWQEIATACPGIMRRFLAGKYGIIALTS